MKFYEGSEANAQSYLDGIYLATDTHKLFYKGSPYGGDPYTELDWIQDFKSGSGTMEEAAFNKLKDAVDNYKLLVVSCSGAAHSTRVCTPEIGDDGSYICKFTDINNYDNADTYILAVKIASVNPSTRAITMLHDTTYPLGGSEVDLSNYYTIAQVDEKIGTNIYTGANYISKENNLTEAVLQLDEEIKATNDNLALEHTNAEATYAKKTELSNQIEAVQADVNYTNTKIVNAKLSMASWTSGANATKLTFTGSSAGVGGTPAIFFAQGGITGGGNTIPTRSCIRFEGCHIYQDSNGFYVSLPKATDTSDGVMSGEDHKKLGGILNTTKNWVNEVRNDSIPTLPSSATVYKIMDLPGMSAECRASLYLICVQISGSSDKPRIYHNDETLCYLQPVVNGPYQYATGIMVLPDYSISGIYLGETYDYTNN